MKRKILLVIGPFLIGAIFWLIYIFITKPDIRELEESISNSIQAYITPDQQSYDSLVSIDVANNKTFLLEKAVYSEIWNNRFPFRKHKFNFDQTERVLKILNDSSTYDWGEIGTPYYDKTITFYGKKNEVIGYTIVSFDGQVRLSPDIALTKWGLLSDKGFKDLIIAIQTE